MVSCRLPIEYVRPLFQFVCPVGTSESVCPSLPIGTERRASEILAALGARASATSGKTSKVSSSAAMMSMARSLSPCPAALPKPVSGWISTSGFQLTSKGSIRHPGCVPDYPTNDRIWLIPAKFDRLMVGVVRAGFEARGVVEIALKSCLAGAIQDDVEASGP